MCIAHLVKVKRWPKKYFQGNQPPTQQGSLRVMGPRCRDCIFVALKVDVFNFEIFSSYDAHFWTRNWAIFHFFRKSLIFTISIPPGQGMHPKLGFLGYKCCLVDRQQSYEKNFQYRHTALHRGGPKKDNFSHFCVRLEKYGI